MSEHTQNEYDHTQNQETHSGCDETQSGQCMPKAVDCMLIGNMDAQVWAKEFMRIWADKNYEVEFIDEGLMIGWFANAIMTGYDNARNRESLPKSAPTEDEVREKTRQVYPTLDHRYNTLMWYEIEDLVVDMVEYFLINRGSGNKTEPSPVTLTTAEKSPPTLLPDEGEVDVAIEEAFAESENAWIADHDGADAGFEAGFKQGVAWDLARLRDLALTLTTDSESDFSLKDMKIVRIKKDVDRIADLENDLSLLKLKLDLSLKRNSALEQELAEYKAQVVPAHKCVAVLDEALASIHATTDKRTE